MKRDLCTAEIEAWELGEARHSRARVQAAMSALAAERAASVRKVAIVVAIALPLLIAGVVALVRHLVRY